MAESMVHSLVIPIIGYYLASPAFDTEMIDDYVLINPYMIDGVLSSLHMNEY